MNFPGVEITTFHSTTPTKSRFSTLGKRKSKNILPITCSKPKIVDFDFPNFVFTSGLNQNIFDKR